MILSLLQPTTDWPTDVRDEAIRHWMGQLDIMTGPLRGEAVAQLKQRLNPVSQQALTESQANQRPVAASTEIVDMYHINPEELEG